MIKSFFAFLFFFGVTFAQTEFNWIKLGNGVEFTQTQNSGNDIFIGFGGWSVKQENNNIWCENLYSAKLNELGIKYLFSVKGPDTPCYLEKETDNLTLARKLIELISDNKSDIKRIIIAAHSSGSFVAHQLFQILYGQNKIDTLDITTDKIVYFNLDGGIGSKDCGFELDSTVVSKLSRIFAVYAFDKTRNIYSPNYYDMIELGMLYHPKSKTIEIDASESLCKGKWCIHDVLINKKPHNPESFDLIKDYNTFDEKHSVQTDYLNFLHK